MKNTYYHLFHRLMKVYSSNGKARFRFSLLLVIYSLVLVFLGLTVLASIHADIPIAVFVRDPIIVMGGSPIIGVQSNLGVLIWLASASVCFFCSALLRHDLSFVERQHNYQGLKHKSLKHKSAADFFCWSGVITLWLTLDDMFLFHEYLPKFIPRTSQAYIYVVYGLFLTWHIARFRKYIAQSGSSCLALSALFFLGLSVFSDIVQDIWDSPWRIFFEDGFKLLGIVSWSSYLISIGFQAVKQGLAEKVVDPQL